MLQLILDWIYEVETEFTTIANFTKNPRQLQAWDTLFNSQCKYLLYGGAAHGGKSYFLRWAAAGLGMYYYMKYGKKHIPIGLFSRDYPTLKDRQIAKIKWEFPTWLGALRDDRDEGYIFEAAEEYGSWRILLRNLDDPSKYKSAEFAAIFVEELTENPVETFEDLRFRLRHKDVGGEVKFVGATNPDGIGNSWIKKKWISPNPRDLDTEQDRFFFVKSLPTDNPFTTNEYIKQLESMPESKRRAWLEGDWNRFEGQVFTEWLDRTHVVKPFTIPDNWKRYIAMDWGSNKPFSVGWYAVDFDGRSYLYRELYLTSTQFEVKFGVPLTARRLARVILGITSKAKETYEYCVADPSMWNKILLGEPGKHNHEGESYAEIMIDAGLKMIQGDNNRLNGLAKYREVLSIAPDEKPWYQVFDSCYDTVRTIPALIYDKTRYEDVDTDGEDHCYDRDKYFFMSRPGVPIDKPKELTMMQIAKARAIKNMLANEDSEYGQEQW